MSRSRKNTPKIGITSAESEKDNKRQANRKLRRVTKVKIKMEEKDLPGMKEIADIQAFDKDGKRYIKKPGAKDFRK